MENRLARPADDGYAQSLLCPYAAYAGVRSWMIRQPRPENAHSVHQVRPVNNGVSSQACGAGCYTGNSRTAVIAKAGEAMIERYSRPEMATLWSDETKYDAWLQVEMAVCEAWAEIGVIPAESLPALRRARYDLTRMRAIEAETGHDVIAF